MARKNDVYPVCLTSDEDEPLSEPADDPKDLDFAPFPFVRRPKPAVVVPPQPTAAAPLLLVDGGTVLNEVAAPAPHAPSFPHDLASAKQYLITNMSAQGHKRPWIRYDLV